MLLAPTLLQAAHLLSAGSFVPYVGKAQVSEAGSRRILEINPYFSYGRQFHLGGSNYFMPEVGLAFYLDNAKKTKRRTFFLKYDFSRILSQKFILRYGLSTYWHTITGEGGSVKLRNGNVYQEFEAPSKSVTTFYSTLDLGGEYFLRNLRSIRFDLNLMNARDWDNRAWNYLLTYNWYF